MGLSCQSSEPGEVVAGCFEQTSSNSASLPVTPFGSSVPCRPPLRSLGPPAFLAGWVHGGGQEAVEMSGLPIPLPPMPRPVVAPLCGPSSFPARQTHWSHLPPSWGPLSHPSTPRGGSSLLLITFSCLMIPFFGHICSSISMTSLCAKCAGQWKPQDLSSPRNMMTFLLGPECYKPPGLPVSNLHQITRELPDSASTLPHHQKALFHLSC